MVYNSGRNALRRRTDEADYWRKQAGWYDDDEAMKAYNNGVYNTNYVGDDDGSASWSSGGGSLSNKSSETSSSISGSPSELSFGMKITAAILSILAAVYVFRVLSRRKKKSSSSTKGGRSGRSSSRSRSRSRSGRSRSRTRRSGGTSSNYELMGEEPRRSRSMSGRSRSRSRRSRSKSRGSKGRSKSRSRRETQVLV